MSIAGSPGGVEAAADTLAGAGRDFADTADSIASHGRAVTAHWSGSASDAAGRAIAVLATRTRVGADVCAEVAPVLRTYAAELRAAQQQYEHASAAADAGAALVASVQADQGAAEGLGQVSPGQATESARAAATRALDRAHQAVHDAQVSMADAVARAERANATAAVALSDQLAAMAPTSTAIATATGGTGAGGSGTPGAAATAPVGWPEPYQEPAPPAASTGGDGGPWYERAWDATRADLDHAAQDVGDFAGSVSGYYAEHPDELGKLLGSSMLMDAGMLVTLLGAGVEVGGVALDLTVIGGVIGVPANVAGAGIMATGASIAGTGALSAGQDLRTMMQERHTSGEGAGASAGEDWLGEARTKIPSDWGPGTPTNKGAGTRWQDPDYKGNGVRVDQGNPHNSHVIQQGDHVVVRHGGKVVGRDGKPITGAVDESPEMSHIPLKEWLTWSTWYAP